MDPLIQTFINYADLLFESGQVQEAEVIYVSILKYRCNHVLAHYNLAKLYETIGEIDSALKHYGVLSEIHPIADVHFSLAKLLTLKENMSEKSIEHLIKATEIQPLMKPAWNMLAHIYKMLRRFISISCPWIQITLHRITI